MKKGIKYAGIAAATLLTVAPVVAPVVGSTTQTVQAAVDSDSTEVTDAQKTALKKLAALYDSKVTLNQSDFDALHLGANTEAIPGENGAQETPASTDGIVSGNYNTEITYDVLSNLAVFSGLNVGGYSLSPSNLAQLDGKKNNQGNNIKYVISTPDANGKARTFESFKALAKDVQDNGQSLTLRIQAVNSSEYNADKQTGILGSKEIEIVNTKATEDTSKANVYTFDYTSPINVDAESKTVNVKLQESASVKATKAEKELKLDKVEVGNTLYKNADAALKSSDKQSDKFTDANFGSEEATYYQTLTITTPSANDLAKVFDDHQKGEKSSDILVNGSRILKFQIDGTNTNKLTVVREIHVSKKAPAWTVEDVKGKVQVTGDKQIGMTLTNGKDAGRGLAPDTYWLTDKKRTNANGDVQYRVSSEEWVNANDVKFIANSTTTNPSTDALTDVQDLQGRHVVTLDGPAGFVYSLFTVEGNKSDRGLAGLTSWATDKTAKDSDGTVYYRVSTNEWIKAGNGVNFK